MAEHGTIDLLLGDLFRHETYYSGLTDDARPGRLLRRAGPGRGARRRRARDVRAGRVSRLDRRARRALDVPEVPVPAPDRLAGLRRRQGLGRLLRRAARPAQRRDRDGDAARPGRVRTVLRDARAARRWPPAAGPRARARATGRGSSRCSTPRSGWSSWSRDPEITSSEVRTLPTEPPTEGVGTVEAPRGTLTHHYWTDERGILTRRQPHRRDDQQSRPDRDVDRPGRARPDPARGRGRRRPARPDRDGVPCLRPVLRLRDPLPARPDAARGDHQGRSRGDGRCPSARRLTGRCRPSSSGWGIRSSGTTVWAGRSSTSSRGGSATAARIGAVELDRMSVGGLTLMERLVGYERAIVVDAVLGQDRPGTVRALPPPGGRCTSRRPPRLGARRITRRGDRRRSGARGTTARRHHGRGHRGPARRRVRRAAVAPRLPGRSPGRPTRSSACWPVARNEPPDARVGDRRTDRRRGGRARLGRRVGADHGRPPRDRRGIRRGGGVPRAVLAAGRAGPRPPKEPGSTSAPPTTHGHAGSLPSMSSTRQTRPPAP